MPLSTKIQFVLPQYVCFFSPRFDEDHLFLLAHVDSFESMLIQDKYNLLFV